MSTTARPCSARRRTSSSTCSVCATPRAAVGSSRMTSFEFHSRPARPRPTGADRPRASPPAWRIDEIVVTRSDLSVSAVRCSITGSLSTLERVVRLTPEEHVLDDVEVVAEGEILVDDLDPEPRRVLRAARCAPAGPSKRISPLSAAWIPAIVLISVDLPAPLSPTSATPRRGAPRSRRRSAPGPTRRTS